MQKMISAFCLFTVTFGVGFFLLNSRTDNTPANRDPAAIAKVYDFSDLHGEKLQEAVKQRLFTGFQLKKTDEGEGITLGHFLFVDSRGDKKAACQEFNKVTLNFEADDSSVSGEAPKMYIQGHCDSSSDLATINPLWIPVAKILGEKPGDGDFEFHQGSDIQVTFDNIPDEWPHTWILKSVKLINDKNSESLTVNQTEISRYLGHSLVLKW